MRLCVFDLQCSLFTLWNHWYLPCLLHLLIPCVAWKDGAARRLTNGIDFRAEICGVGKLKHLKYQYYPVPSNDINVKFCVESCPATSVHTRFVI